MSFLWNERERGLRRLYAVSSESQLTYILIKGQGKVNSPLRNGIIRVQGNTVSNKVGDRPPGGRVGADSFKGIFALDAKSRFRYCSQTGFCAE